MVKQLIDNVTENHLQTIMLAIMVGVFAWVGYTVTQTSRMVAKLEIQVQHMAVIITKLEGKVEGTHLLKFRVDQMEGKIKTLERDMNDVLSTVELKNNMRVLSR